MTSPEGHSGRRYDPAGKQALFTSPPMAPSDHLATGRTREGRASLFSTGPRRAGTVVVECQTCAVRSRVSLVDLGFRLLRVSVWLPGRRHSHWMVCPACATHTWCSIGWND